MLTPTVERYMTRDPYSVASNDNLVRARALMEAHAIRHLPVVDGDLLVGVIGDRDISVVAAIPGVDLAHVEVSRVMAEPLSACVTDTVEEVSALMASRKHDCVVVRGRHGVVGIFTAIDALEALADVVRRACA